MSQSTLVGNLTVDPVLRFTAAGKATCTFGVADNNGYRNNSGEWVEKTSFFNVVVWGPQAENVAQSLGKGDRVILNGRFEQRNFENEDGRKGSVIEFNAAEIAPSLKWATVEVTRNPRNDSGGATTRQRPQAQQSAAPPANDGGYDEEPF